jgi:site-specific DNA recombinase
MSRRAPGAVPARRPDPLRKVRCAVYTRKSTEEGLDQAFNTLHAQREACEAYVASQRHEGWLALSDRYDDGGYSGGSMERPALQRLMHDIETGLIDVVVVYKVDRLSRSLMDFTRVVELFEGYDVSFVSVTPHFNTTTSMGRLTLNILLSFAQFEREVIGERIRDKVAASRAKGMWMGGCPPLGYDVRERKLVVNDAEADLVRHIFRRFLQVGSGTKLVRELKAECRSTKSWTTQDGKRREGRPFGKGTLYKLLNNQVYLGEIVHKGSAYPGEHEPIVGRDLWNKVQAVLAENAKARANRMRARTPALLRGIIRCAAHDCAMGPTFTRKQGRLYRYYLCTHAAKHGYDSCPNPSLSAGEIETAVVHQLRGLFGSPEILARTFRAATERHAAEVERLRKEKADLEDRTRILSEMADRALRVEADGDNVVLNRVNADLADAEKRMAAVTDDLATLERRAVTERDIIDALERLDPVWDELFPVEQERIVRLLVERVEVSPDGLDVRIRANGLRTLVTEVAARAERSAA